jgi:Cu2+-exporting ATPase
MVKATHHGQDHHDAHPAPADTAVDHAGHGQAAGHPAHGEHGGHGEPASHGAHGEHGGHGGHDKHAGHDPEMFRRKFWLSLLLTLPIVATSHMVMDWFGYSLDFPGMSWVGPVLGTFVFFYGGCGPLAGDESHRPGPRRPRRAGRAAAGRRRPRHR